jgi:hypothetical protein
VKRARLLSQKQIRELVMDSDSDEQQYCASSDTEDEEQPCLPSRRSSISQPSSPDYSSSSSEDEDEVGNVACRQPHPSLWTLPPKPRRRVVHTFIGALTGKAVKLHAQLQSPIHFAFCCCSSRKLLLCWLWGRIGTTTSS